MTGRAATLQVSRTLSGAAGAYSLTGQAGTLTYTPVAGSTAYSLSGAAGSYALTGQAGAFSVARALSGAPGAYTFTGQPGAFSYTSTGPQAYSLTGEAGAYLLTGFEGTFAYSGASTGAGKGKTLADYETEWALQRANEAIDRAQKAPSQERRRIKRQAAREVYFKAPAEIQQQSDQLKARRDIAQIAEIRALLDMAAAQSSAQAEIARVAVDMARKKKREADAAIEEFDVMYVAAVLAEA